MKPDRFLDKNIFKIHSLLLDPVRLGYNIILYQLRKYDHCHKHRLL